MPDRLHHTGGAGRNGARNEWEPHPYASEAQAANQGFNLRSRAVTIAATAYIVMQYFGLEVAVSASRRAAWGVLFFAENEPRSL